MRFAPLVLVIALVLGGAAAAKETKSPPEPDAYIFDVLVLQPYKGSFARLVKADDVPEWVKAISAKGEGTAVPSKTVDIGGTPYRLDHVCKPHDCAGNTLDVLWAPAGHKVWAALVEGGKAPILLGGPPVPEAKALTDPTAPAAATEPVPASPPAAPAETASLPAKPASSAPSPEPDTYIFDVLAMQPYKGNLARLAKSKGTPEWVKDITLKGEGTAVPSKTIDIAGTPYRLDHVCKPHDCAGNTLDVLWAPAGRKVWAALVDGGKPPVLLGGPKGPQAKALMDAMAFTGPAPVAPASTPPAAATLSGGTGSAPAK